MKPSNRVALNTGILYVRMAITICLSLYTTRVTLQALGMGDYGIFNLVSSVIIMLGFLNASMASATQRFMSFAMGQGETTRLKKIFSVSVITHLIIAIAMIIIFEIVGFFLFDGFLKINPERLWAAAVTYQLAIFGVFFTIISVPYEAAITAHENMLVFAILEIIERSLKLISAFVVIHFEMDRLVSYSLLTASITVILFIIRAAYCHLSYTECTFKIRKNLEMPLFREMGAFAGWSFMGSSTSMIAGYGQGIVLNSFFGTVVNAAQGISSQVSGQVGALANTMLRALNPMIVKSEGSGNRKLMVDTAMAGSKISFAMLMLFCVPVLIEAPYLFSVWLNDIPAYAVIFCRLLIVRNLIEQLYHTLYSCISAVGNIRFFQVCTSLLNISPLILSYFVFDRGAPPYALYLIFLIYAILNFFLILIFCKVTFQLPVGKYIFNIVVRCLLGFSLLYGFSYIPFLIFPIGPTRLICTVMCDIIAFGPIVWIVILSESDRKHLSQLIHVIYQKVLALFIVRLRTGDR